MEIDLDEIRKHYELLSDETLLGTKRDDLVDAAKAIFDEEVARRGLHESDIPVAEAVHEPAPTEEEEEHAGDQGLVAVGTFTDLDEARLARGLLQSAGIPSGLANDKASLGVLHLMVPQSEEQQALSVLGGEISDDELAAQAEAAGFDDDEEDEVTEEEESEE